MNSRNKMVLLDYICTITFPHNYFEMLFLIKWP